MQTAAVVPKPAEMGAVGTTRTPGSGPERIGRYEVVRELGHGSMGIVYEAKDPALARTVALKTIDIAVAAGFGGREEFEKRFFAEARVAARLSHPGIVGCHDLGKDPDTGTLFIVLEYLKGETLEQRIKARGAVGWLEAAGIIAKVARAAHHAHHHGVIHRDLKPANVMLLDSGEPKIMDFGIAKVETARMNLTAAGHFLGSPLYMSPEQALGNAIDPRSDIFSLGTILCTLLVGRSYFAAPNIPSILARIIREDPPVLSDVVAGVPPPLNYVIGRAMAKVPAGRYPSADVMADDLEDVLASRSPRHAGGWSPVRADGTMVGGPRHDALLVEMTAPQGRVDAAGPAAAADPLEELRSLVEEAIPEAPAAARKTSPMPLVRERIPSAAPAEAYRPGNTRAIPRSGRGRMAGARPALLAVVLVAAVAICGSLFVRSWLARDSASTAPGSASEPTQAPKTAANPDPVPSSPSEPHGEGSREPGGTEVEAPPDAEAPAPKVNGSPPGSVAASRSESPGALPGPIKSRLLLTIEHPLKSGHLRLWIDELLAYETELEARVGKKIVAIKIREGRIQKTLEIAPGKHEIRVAVAWDDNERIETTFASFRPGSGRELEIKLGRIRKNLSLEWK